MLRTRPLFIITLVTQLAITTSCVHLSSVPAFPKPFAERFDRHNMWLSITFFTDDATESPLFDFVVTKRWEVKQTQDGRNYLENFTTTSPAGMSELMNKAAIRFFVDDSVSGQYFLPTTYAPVEGVNRWSSDNYQFRDIDGTRFEIDINDGLGRVVFVPAPNSYHMAADLYDGKPIGIWTTPFGPTSEFVHDLTERLTDPQSLQKLEEFIAKAGTRYYLHHDIKTDHQVAIFIDESFPRTFIIPLKKAADQWNAAIGKSLFRVHVKPKPINFAECFSGRQLCIRWEGDSEFPYTGLTAFTEMAHDPQTGLILGGVISVVNDSDAADLTPMDGDKRRDIVNGDFDLDFVAEAMVNSSTYATTKHPSPNALVERLFVHEMGHFNGLSHNFAATATSDLSTLSRSTMAYLPFPVAHRMTKLGELDIELINIIYKQQKPKIKIPFCSTSDAIFPYGEKGKYYKPYPCEVSSVGPKSDWYVRLAKISAAGILEAYPDIRDLPDDIKTRYQEREEAGYPPRNILTHLGYALAEGSGIPQADEKIIVKYLCDQQASLQRIKDQLLMHHQYVLVCKKW